MTQSDDNKSSISTNFERHWMKKARWKKILPSILSCFNISCMERTAECNSVESASGFNCSRSFKSEPSASEQSSGSRLLNSANIENRHFRLIRTTWSPLFNSWNMYFSKINICNNNAKILTRNNKVKMSKKKYVDALDWLIIERKKEFLKQEIFARQSAETEINTIRHNQLFANIKY